MNSPLMIGCDIRRMTPATKEILTNKDVIAINQDIECRGPYCIKQWNNPDNVFSLVKPLANGDYAIGMFNFGDRAGEMSLQFWDIGLPPLPDAVFPFTTAGSTRSSARSQSASLQPWSPTATQFCALRS